MLGKSTGIVPTQEHARLPDTLHLPNAAGQFRPRLSDLKRFRGFARRAELGIMSHPREIEIMSDADQLRLAVVGVGALGRHHARILSEMDDVQLVVVAEPNQAQGEGVAEKCRCEWTPDYRTLFGRVDAVSIVVPTFLHRSIGEAFLLRDIPVLIEKPLTASVEDGEALCRIARDIDVPLQVGHIERFNPAFEKVQSWVHDPKYIRAERVSPYAFRSMDVSVVHDLMIHDIELVLSLTGRVPERVEAFGASLAGGHPDSVQARLYFPGGCIADLTANRVAPTARRTIQCWSAEGCVSADLHSRTVTRFSPGPAIQSGAVPYHLAMQNPAATETLKPQMFSRFIQTEEFHAPETDALTAELQAFLDCVRDRTRPLVSGDQGLAALQVAMRVLDSVDKHLWDGVPNGRCGPQALLEYHLPELEQRWAA